MKQTSLFLLLFVCVVSSLRAQFISQISETGSNITLSAVQVMGSGYIAAGSENNKVLLCEISNSGAVLSSREIVIVDESILPYVSSLVVDSEGRIVIAGYRVTADPYQYKSFVCRYDYAAATVNWIKLFENPGSAFLGMIEKKPGGPYIVCGQSVNSPNGEEGLLYSVNRNTGAFTLLNNYNFNNSSETYYNVIRAGGGYYTANRYNYEGGGSNRMRGTLSKFSYTGAESFTKAYLRNITTETARLYAADLCYAFSSIYMTVHGDETGTAVNDDLFVVRAKTDGNLSWAKLYDLTNHSDDGSFSSIKGKGANLYALGALNDGAPDYTGDLFLMKLDSAGNVIWANSYNVQSNTRSGRSNSLLINGANVITVGYVPDVFTGLNNGVFMVVKAATGTLPDGCSTVEPVNVISKTSTSYTSTLSSVVHAYTISGPVNTTAVSDEEFLKVCSNNDRMEDEHSFPGIYPNPTTGVFDIQLKGNQNTVELYIYNGQLIYSVTTGGSVVQINIESQPAGIYFAKIKNTATGEVISAPVIKQ